MAFRIAEHESLPLPGSLNRAVVDDGRSAVLQLVSGMGRMPGGFAMLLSWKGRVIPFGIRQERLTSADGAPIRKTSFLSFGYSSTVRASMGLGQTAFENVEERREAQLLATEALLVYGGFFDGLNSPNGFNCIDFEDRLWVLSDFSLS